METDMTSLLDKLALTRLARPAGGHFRSDV